jgi:fumarate reductase flavoprotein subunit
MNRIPAEFDAVVIGSGVSGLAAAVTLAESGASVIVFEKQHSLGGSSNFLKGIFAVESDLQRERYIAYGCDEAFRNIMEYSHWRANPRLVRAIVNESAATIAWLQKQGVVFSDVVANIPNAPQTYHLVKDSGVDIIKALAARATELGAVIKKATPVEEILRAGKRITGVIVKENGEEVRVASKAVIIASGGYANNSEWIKKYTGLDLGVNLIPIGNKGKMGDGIRMAFQVGAAAEGLGVLELLRTGRDKPGAMSAIGYAVVQPNLWINDQGERFCDESVTFDDTSMGNASVRQKNGCTYSIFDTSIVQYLMERGMDKAMEMDFPPGSRLPGLARELEEAAVTRRTEVFQADSIKELAPKIGVSPVTLQATVDEYNRFCDKGHDELLAKDPKYLRPIKGPRFYAIKAQTAFLGTLGGIKINHKTEVLDKKDSVIPGLYAVGFDAGGNYGDSYCIRNSTGLSSSFAVNSGRIAGRIALEYLGRCKSSGKTGHLRDKG